MVRKINALILDDDDLECNCENKTLDDINVALLAFNMNELDKFDMVIYNGKKGMKVVKSKYTKTGKVE